MTPTECAVRSLLAEPPSAMPLPGRGRTADRHMRLFDIARHHPLSVARLFEAHTDAVAILCEADHRPEPGCLYAVWASSGPNDGVALSSTAETATVSGTKGFCSGTGIVDRALITAIDRDHSLVMVDIDARPGASLHFDTTGWHTETLSETATGQARLDRHSVRRPILGDVDRWYLDRPGFWYGACGPAACWAGGAAGLVDAAEQMVDSDPHRQADLGAMRAARWAMESSLTVAGDQIDHDDGRSGQRVALSLRHTIERLATEVLDRFGQAFGPRPFVADAALGQRWYDTHLYLRQHHGARDLEALGRTP